MDVEFIRYKFENGYYGVITNNQLKLGIRHIQMVYMFMTSMVLGFVRGSMAIAVMAITVDERPSYYHSTNIMIHNWDERIKGAILSSFFFGYALMLIPAELFLKRIGGKWLMTFILIANGGLAAAMPTIVNKGGWVAVCNAKLIMGLTHGCLFSVNQSLINSWLPPSERKFFNFFIYGGVQIGLIVGLSVSGLLTTERLGWELVYYTMAMMALSMAAITFALTASSPDHHEAVGDDEKTFIRESLEYYRKKDLQTPWREIAKCSHFWAVTGSMVTSNILFVFYIVFGPAWLRTANIDGSLRSGAVGTMYPVLAMVIVYVTVSPLADWVCGWRYLRIIIRPNLFRKMINILGTLGIVIGLMIWPNTSADWNFTGNIAFVAILGFLGFQYCGFLSSFKDMSENFAGSLMMISCTVSSVAGAAVPFVSGLILADDPLDPSKWRTMKLTICSLYIISAVIYTLFGSHKRQYWDLLNEKKTFGLQNVGMDVSHLQLEEYGSDKVALSEPAIDTTL